MKALTFSLKFLLGAAGALALLLVIAFNLAVVWVATQPRPLTAYLPAISQKINAAQSEYTVEITDGKLLWDGWKRPFDVRLQDVRLRTREGVLFAQFPEISVTANLLALLQGKLLPSTVILEKPSLVLERQTDGTLSLGFGTEVKAPISTPLDRISSPNETVEDLGLTKLLAYLNRVELKDASVAATDIASGNTLNLSAPSIALRRFGENLEGAVVLNILDANGQAAAAILQGRMGLKSLSGKMEAQLRHVNLAPFIAFVPQLAPLAGVDVPVSGQIELETDAKGKPRRGRLELVLDKGQLQHNSLESPIPITSATLRARILDNTLQLDEARFQSESKAFEARGKLWQTEAGVGIALDGIGRNVPIDDVRLFWPKDLAPISREWVVSNLSHGVVDAATLKVRLQPGMLALERFPNEAILAIVPFRDAKVRYKPQHDEVEKVAGVATINANQLFVDLSTASALQATTMSKGRLTIDDLIIDNPRITVAFDVAAPLSDVARFLTYPDINHSAHLGLTPENVGGNMSGRVDVGFDYFAPKDTNGNLIEEEMLDLNIRGRVENGNASNLLKKFDISNATGDVSLSMKGMEFKGRAAVFGSLLDAQVTQDFTGREPISTRISAKGVVSDTTLKKLGADLSSTFKGSASVDAVIEQRGDATKLEATADVTPATITIDALNWVKPTGDAASLNLNLTLKGDEVDVDKFRLKAGTTEFSGSAALHASTGELTQLKASDVTLGRNRFAVDYAPIEGGKRINIHGQALDLQAMLEKEGEGMSFKNFPALQLNAKLEKVYLAEGVIASDLNASAQCTTLRCTSATAGGMLDGQKKFSLNIVSGPKRSFTVQAEDAGTFLRGLGIFSDMHGGTLAIESAYEDSKPSAPLVGIITILDYRVKEAGALAKLLTLASVAGIMDTLQGNEGIKFEKFKGNFELKNDIITVNNLRSVGDSLGLVMDGTVDVANQNIDMKGTLVPSYTINSMFKDVPIIGEILTGGEGIIAAVFTLTGSTSNPEVAVNPLSILAPGFLRKMFE